MNSTDNELQLNIIFYCQLAHDGVRVRLLASLRQLFVVLRTEVSHLHPIQIYYIIISLSKLPSRSSTSIPSTFPTMPHQRPSLASTRWLNSWSGRAWRKEKYFILEPSKNHRVVLLDHKIFPKLSFLSLGSALRAAISSLEA